jgi:hypothetical protein
VVSLPTAHNGQKVTDENVRSVIAFSFYYGLTVAIIASGLSLLGIDSLTSSSGVTTAVGSIGTGLGDIIGPDKNFATLPHATKWQLSIGMLLGRLEIMTVVILYYTGVLTPLDNTFRVTGLKNQSYSTAESRQATCQWRMIRPWRTRRLKSPRPGTDMVVDTPGIRAGYPG